MTSQNWHSSRPFPLLDDGAARFAQAGIHFVQLCLILDLNPKMIEARFATACRDRKVHARIIEHPLCVIRFHYDGCASNKAE